jgi:hypothetical protein
MEGSYCKKTTPVSVKTIKVRTLIVMKILMKNAIELKITVIIEATMMLFERADIN